MKQEKGNHDMSKSFTDQPSTRFVIVNTCSINTTPEA